MMEYDRQLAYFSGMPENQCIKTRPSTVELTDPDRTQRKFTVQTFREREGDTIFIELRDTNGTTRLVLPTTVSDAIAGQRHRLTLQDRERATGKSLAERESQGFLPGMKEVHNQNP